MSVDPPEVTALRIQADKRRGQLIDSARLLQERLNPQTLAQNAWADAKTKGAEVANEAVDAVKRRPAVAGGVVAALALFLAREPLLDLAGKAVDGVTGKGKPRRQRKSKTKESTETSE